MYALVKGVCQTKGLMSLMKDFGYEFKATACSDASAAIGIAYRQGLGKVRHVDVQYLWIQSEVAQGKVGLRKVDTKENPADLMTKPVNAETMHKHMAKLCFKVSKSRASLAPHL